MMLQIIVYVEFGITLSKPLLLDRFTPKKKGKIDMLRLLFFFNKDLIYTKHKHAS